MVQLLRNARRWTGCLVILALMLAFSNLGANASSGMMSLGSASETSSYDHAHMNGHDDIDDDHHHSPPPAGQRDCHCVAGGLCVVAVFTIAAQIAPPPVAGDDMVLVAAAKVPLVSVTPPQKPPRA